MKKLFKILCSMGIHWRKIIAREEDYYVKRCVQCGTLKFISNH